MINDEDKLLNNGLLFNVLRKPKTPEDKIKKIKKYLDRGADINAADANNKNNTPLHIAVLKEETEIVSFLLKEGADVHKKNSDNASALDIARKLDTCKTRAIVSILANLTDSNVKEASSQPNDPSRRKSETNSQEPKILEIIHSSKASADIRNLHVVCNVKSETNIKTVNKKDATINKKQITNPKQQKSAKKVKTAETFQYPKRSGTSGLSGQLYETKLLCLILFRALYIRNVSTFLMATNVESMGAFDDIVFRYCLKKDNIPRIMFIQAKHRDNPAKDKFTVEEILRLNGDFSLHKYLESYLKISQMFDPDNNDDMFRGEFKNIDCDFVIYTSAIENFTKMKALEHTEGKSFIATSSEGKVFQFDYDNQDVESLVQTVAKSRTVLLAKRLSKFIFKDNYSNMMMDDLITTYHVFMAQHILTVEFKQGESQNNNFNYAKFRETFFTSDDLLMLVFKATIFKEATQLKKKISSENPDELERLLKSLSFKLPINFGNVNFSFSGSDQKKKRRLDYLCSKFKKLFESADLSESDYIVVKVDDNMVGPNEMLQSTDVENYRLGGLVGNLLIFDEDTKALKFNTDLDSLSEDNLKLFERFKCEALLDLDISKCRLDINVHRFPRLSLVHDGYDKNLIKEFLNKLIFYTNQATEDDVEEKIKQEVDKYFVQSMPRQSHTLLRVKGDAIFLKVHDRVQKWWKKPTKAPYLTDSCKFFFQAEQDILNSPLLSILNFTYTKKIKNNLPELKFKENALELLELKYFFGGPARILTITTDEIALSSLKLLQYFEEHNDITYTIIDLDYFGFRKDFEDVKSEIQESKLNTLIIVSKNEDVISEIDLLIKLFKGKVIIITEWGWTHQIEMAPENFVKKIDKITIMDLVDSVRMILFKERYVIFQGKEVPLGVLFENELCYLLNSTVMYKIINNEKITLGKNFNNPAYDEILEYYINEQICRYITLDILNTEEFIILKYDDIQDDFQPDTRDIVLIADKLEDFIDFCHMHSNCNVHWFTGKENRVWRKSRGNLLILLKYIQRRSHDSYVLQPVTLKDLDDKVIIISAEPGMGKSSLLTHLAIHTKEHYPDMWISKINLLETTHKLDRLKKTVIDLKEAVKFLFLTIGFEAAKSDNFENIVDRISLVRKEISLNINEDKNILNGLELLEVELFIHCFNTGKVAILFDGFDEICPDYASEFLQLVNIIKRSKVAHLWVTSRLYNVLHQLENSLETFSYTIQPLSYENQVEFLEKVWSKSRKNKLIYFPFNKEWGFKNLIKGFLSVLSAVLCDTGYKFISIPLHLYMISEIFQDTFDSFPLVAESITYFIRKQSTMSKVNLNQVYGRFVDVKFFKIRFGEKKPFLCINDPDIRKLLDNERTAFLNIHKKIAAHLVFGKADVIHILVPHEIKEIYDFIERIKVGGEKTGVIEQIVDNEPKFVHFTFVEYFATELFCDRLKLPQYRYYLWTYLINKILLSDDGGIRRFFNAKLGNDPQMYDDLINNDDVRNIFQGILIEDNKLVSLLFTAIDDYLENTAILLLKCVKMVLNDDNINDFISLVTMSGKHSCIVCFTVDRSAKSVVNFIIDIIKDFDASRIIELLICGDLPKSNPMLLAYGYNDLPPNLEMLDMFLSVCSPSAISKIFLTQINNLWFNKIRTKNYIHIIANSLGNERFRCFEKALKRLNCDQLLSIFSAKNSEKKLAAHVAASEQSYIFFDVMDSLLDRTSFKEICKTVDRSGLTPLHYFKYNKYECERLQTLLDIVYDDATGVKLTLNYFIEQEKKK